MDGVDRWIMLRVLSVLIFLREYPTQRCYESR